jgi:hypothetical protein
LFFIFLPSYRFERSSGEVPELTWFLVAQDTIAFNVLGYHNKKTFVTQSELLVFAASAEAPFHPSSPRRGRDMG